VTGPQTRFRLGPIEKDVRHMRRNTGQLVLTALIAIAVLALAPAAYAAKSSGAGGNGGGKPTHGTGTISLVLDNSTDGAAHYGQTVEFTILTTATTEPWVGLKCYQNGTLVAEGWDGYFDGSLSSRTFGLASPSWTGGDADCTATLTTPQWAPLGSTSFHVYA
jgi:hypothetical protein